MNPVFIVLWGGPGSIKSTIAASMAVHGKLGWHSFDVGGDSRARWPKSAVEPHVTTLPAPNRLKLAKKRVNLEGWKELWETHLNALSDDLEDPDIFGIVFDTGTRQWVACHRAYLQLKQETAVAAGKSAPDGLIQIEYGEVNPWMFEVLDAPKNAGKHLIVTMHDEEDRHEELVKGQLESVVIKARDGSVVMKPQGFRHIAKNADLMIHMVLNPMTNKPEGIITKAGMGDTQLTGMVVPEPTFDKLLALCEAAGKLAEAGKPIPGEYGKLMVESMKL